jgi:hypothetical protein
MTTESAYPGDDPQRLLSHARELIQRVRRQQRATWLPLLVFAVLTFVSIPVRRYSGHHLDCRSTSGGGTCRVYSDAEFIYWPVALALAYAGILTFYIRRSRSRGVGTRVRAYAIAGVIVAAALTGVAIWELSQPFSPVWLDSLPYRLASPPAAIGIALLVLGLLERNRALLVLTVAYLAVVLVPITFSSTRFNPPWYGLPAVAQGTVLLIGAIGFAVAQRPLLRPST